MGTEWWDGRYNLDWRFPNFLGLHRSPFFKCSSEKKYLTSPLLKLLSKQLKYLCPNSSVAVWKNIRHELEGKILLFLKINNCLWMGYDLHLLVTLSPWVQIEFLIFSSTLTLSFAWHLIFIITTGKTNKNIKKKNQLCKNKMLWNVCSEIWGWNCETSQALCLCGVRQISSVVTSFKN